MTTSYFTTPEGEGIGYGITIDTSLGFPVDTHGGHIDGYEGTFLYDPLKKITVIILSNVRDTPVYTLAFRN